MERDAPGTERKRPVRQGVVPGARTGGAHLLLPAPQTPAGSLHSLGTGTAVATGRSSAAPKQEENHAKLRLTTKAGTLEIMDADRSVLDQILQAMLHAE